MLLPQHIQLKIKEVYKQQIEQGKRSFYIYDTSYMHNKIQHLKKIMPKGVNIFYAMKANPHNYFLKTAKNAGVKGIEIASLGEGMKCIAAGFSAYELIFTGPGKSHEELEWSVKNNIHTLHIESLTEAYRLNEIAAKHNKIQDILIRINADFDIHDAQANFSGGSKKLGIDEEKLIEYLPIINSLSNLKFKGLHVYAASGVLSVDDLLTNCKLVFSLSQKIELTFPNIKCEIIDFGGGFGIDYLQSNKNFSPDLYAEGLTKLIEEYGFQNRSFVLELGRYLTADSGWYCTEILDIKDSRGIKQIITAGGTNHFRRPAALSINHPVEIIALNQPAIFNKQERVEKEAVFIGGPLCNTADKIANNLYVEKANIGDIAVFCLAGAYGLSMSHTDFLSHYKPEEIII